MNYRTLLEKQFDETLLINILSFQISYIIEYMAHNNINIEIFNECLLKNLLIQLSIYVKNPQILNL